MLNVENKNIFKKESFLMHLLIRLGLNSLAWSLRWLYCPVKKTDLVLEVGSGGSPYFRANILCDAYLNTGERGFVPLVSDRPTVLAFVENLPFKDSSFDFLIASHVLEHSMDPDKFLSEIQRVAKAGYIEVPDAFMERLTNYKAHRLEISEENNCLMIRKKTASTVDIDLEHLFGKAKEIFPNWLTKFPFHFHVRYYWNRQTGGIIHKILNPEYKFDWQYQDSESTQKANINLKIKIKQFVLKIFRVIFSQNKRNKLINIFDYLVCLDCKNDKLNRIDNVLVCQSCGKQYLIHNNIIDFTNNYENSSSR